VTHYCTHYRVKTYETLARLTDVTYFFYSAGREWYWDRSHGVNRGEFKHEYLSGFQVGRTRIVPSLAWKLASAPYDVYVKCINGKFALPVTYFVARLRHKPFVLWTGLWIRLQTRTHRLLWPLRRTSTGTQMPSSRTDRTLLNSSSVRECIPPGFSLRGTRSITMLLIAGRRR